MCGDARLFKEFSNFLKIFIYLYLERGERREKDRVRNINVSEKHPSVSSPTHILGPGTKPGMCPDQELNW